MRNELSRPLNAGISGFNQAKTIWPSLAGVEMGHRLRLASPELSQQGTR